MIVAYILCVIIIILVLIKLYHSIFQTTCRSKVCLSGKTAVVTGGSSGIGYQIVLGLASRGCKVIIADCNVDESIKDAIYKETHNPNIILKYVNLASFKSIREFASDIKNYDEKLDILINNAGIGRGRAVQTEDGINLTMQVNYYSAFLLTHLLLDLLKKSERGGRIIFTTSLMSYVNLLTASSIQKKSMVKGYGYFTYPYSKFCQLCASEIFAEKLKSYGITSNCFHPYAAKTNIFTSCFSGVTWSEYATLIIFFILTEIAGKTAEEAAQTGIYLACANEVQGITGEFFGEMAPSWKPPRTQNKTLTNAIWEDSERVVNLEPEEKIK